MAFWISLALSPYQLAASVSWGQFLAGLAFLPAGAVLAVGTVAIAFIGSAAFAGRAAWPPARPVAIRLRLTSAAPRTRR